MAKLYPYYYNSKSAVYSSGYPDTSSAMYTAYQNWSMAVVFKNTTGQAISISSVNLSLGMNSRAAEGIVTYANLSSLTAETVTPVAISPKFEVTCRTKLTPITYKLSKDLVIKKDQLFVIGFKVVDSGDNNFLSTARTNAVWEAGKERTMYNGQDLTTGLKDLNKDKLQLITKSDVWHHQIPQITLNYTNYVVKPTLSSSSINITQGLSKTITVSGVDSWKYSLVDNAKDYISVSKLGADELKITAKYNGSSDKAVKITIISSTNGKVNLTVNCKPPKIKSVTVSHKTLRPTESAKVTILYNDNQYGTLSSLTSKISGVSVSNNHITVDAIDSLETATGWQRDVNSSETISGFNITHPKNSKIKNTYENVNLIVRHWSESDIKVNFSSNDIWYSPSGRSSAINYADATLVFGGTQIYPEMIIKDGSEITPLLLNANSRTILATTSEYSSAKLKLNLVNDVVVIKTYTISIKIDIDFNLKYPITDVTYSGCKSYLPLYCITSGTKFICNPTNYPLFITIPTNVNSSGIQIDYKFYDNENNKLLEDTKDLFSMFSSAPDLGEQVALFLDDHAVVLNSIPNESSNIYYYLDVVFSWKTQNNISRNSKYTIRFKLKQSSINIFELPSSEIQGQKISYNLHGQAINSIYDDAKIICMNYNIFSNNGLICSSISGKNVGDSDCLILATEKDQKVYLPQHNNWVEQTFSPIIEGDNLGSEQSIKIFEMTAEFINKLAFLINSNTNKKMPGVPQTIARGEYFMWDDSADILANGRKNIFKYTIKGDVDGDMIISDIDISNIQLKASAALLEDMSSIIGGIIGGFIGSPVEYNYNALADYDPRYDIDGDGSITLGDVVLASLARDYNLPRLDTASPWQYIYKFIKKLQLQPDDNALNVAYEDNTAVKNVAYDEETNVAYRR